MARGSARIESPEIIRELRNHFVVFAAASRQALSEVKWDIRKTGEWLQHEQLPHWRKELRKRNEAFIVAKLDYQRARREATRAMHSDAVDAKIAFEKAKRRKEEAETKLRAVNKWASLLDHTVEEQVGPCMTLSGQLDTLVPRALVRLDKMADSLEDYLQAPAPETPLVPEE